MCVRVCSQITELQRALHDRELDLEQWRGPHAQDGEGGGGGGLVGSEGGHTYRTVGWGVEVGGWWEVEGATLTGWWGGWRWGEQ